MSEFYRKNYNSWKDKHPDWEIRLYDDDDLEKFFKEHYKDIYKNIIQTYDKIIYKIDIFKILILNTLGGIYTDMDVECLKSFDELLNDKQGLHKKVIFGYGPYEHNAGQYSNLKLVECAIMISEPNHEFWNKYVIPSLHTKNKCNGNPVSCTGPVFITKCVEDYITNNKGTNELSIVEPVLFYPVNNQMESRISDDLIKKTQDILKTRNFPKESYCVHYFDGAWWNKNSKS
jgi:mannosyltransferase OCH1-like enzyme